MRSLPPHQDPTPGRRARGCHPPCPPPHRSCAAASRSAPPQMTRSRLLLLMSTPVPGTGPGRAPVGRRLAAGSQLPPGVGWWRRLAQWAPAPARGPRLRMGHSHPHLCWLWLQLEPELLRERHHQAPALAAGRRTAHAHRPSCHPAALAVGPLPGLRALHGAAEDVLPMHAHDDDAPRCCGLGRSHGQAWGLVDAKGYEEEGRSGAHNWNMPPAGDGDGDGEAVQMLHHTAGAGSNEAPVRPAGCRCQHCVLRILDTRAVTVRVLGMVVRRV